MTKLIRDQQKAGMTMIYKDFAKRAFRRALPPRVHARFLTLL